MFKLLFILFIIKQSLGNVTSGIDIYSDKQSIIRRGKLSGDNSDRNIAYLKHSNFCVYLFLRAKKIILHEYLCLRMASFWKFRVYKFQSQRKKNKKRQHDNGKTVRSQWKNCCYWLILKKSCINQQFLSIYIYIYIIYIYI